jgi:hypothetical protein
MKTKTIVALLCCLAVSICFAANVSEKSKPVPITSSAIGGVACDVKFVLTQFAAASPRVGTNAVIVRAVDTTKRSPGKMVLIWHEPTATNYHDQTFFKTNAHTATFWKNQDHH